MANIIKIKRGFTAGAEPAGLTLGELAANLGDGRIFIGGTAGNAIELGSTPVGAALLALPNTFTDTNIFQGVVNIENNTPSNSVSTGALVVYGGVGIQEDLYVQGTIYSNGVPVGSGSANIPLATSSITGVASFSPTDFRVSALGAVSLTSGLVYSVNGQTGNVTVSGVSAVVPLATSSITGVASFGNEFVVSTTGNVSLTGNYVKSFNGATGSVVYAPPVATTSVTGVASFNSTYFSVSSGAVSLASAYQVTGDSVTAGNRIAITKTGNLARIENAVPIAGGSITGVASFDKNFFYVTQNGEDPHGGHVTLVPNLFGFVPPEISLTSRSPQEGTGETADKYATAINVPDMVRTNNVELLVAPASSYAPLLVGQTATNETLANTQGLRFQTTSTNTITLVKGVESNVFQFNLGGTGVTLNAISSVYYNAADVTVHAWSNVNADFSIRKFMILGDIDSGLVKYSEHSNLSWGNELGTFMVSATAGYWALTVTPSSSTETFFDINSIRYRGRQFAI